MRGVEIYRYAEAGPRENRAKIGVTETSVCMRYAIKRHMRIGGGCVSEATAHRTNRINHKQIWILLVELSSFGFSFSQSNL